MKNGEGDLLYPWPSALKHGQFLPQCINHRYFALRTSLSLDMQSLGGGSTQWCHAKSGAIWRQQRMISSHSILKSRILTNKPSKTLWEPVSSLPLAVSFCSLDRHTSSEDNLKRKVCTAILKHCLHDLCMHVIHCIKVETRCTRTTQTILPRDWNKPYHSTSHPSVAARRIQMSDMLRMN